MVWLGVLGGCVILGGCADDREEFVGCLEARGGAEVSRQQQVARLDWQRAEEGGGAALEGLDYSLIELPAGRRSGRTLVVLDPGLLQDAALVRAVREEPEQFRDVVLMPARPDPVAGPVEDCLQEISPGSGLADAGEP